MVDTRFYTRKGPFTLGDLCALTRATLSEPSKKDLNITDVSPLASAQQGHVSVFHNRKYMSCFRQSQATACFVEPLYVEKAPSSMTCLVTERPYRAYAQTLAAFYPPSPIQSGISPHAFIDASARIGKGCLIEPGVIIRANVEIGDYTCLYAHAVIEQGVKIGQHCHIDAHVFISHALIGNHVKIYPNSTIGKTGFGFDMDRQGFVSVPQVGRVLIEDHVEIGANCNIDRGSLEDTVIGAGTRIDSLVQFGHNVHVGKGCVIVSQVGIAGSTYLEDYVVIGGQGGLAGHLKIGKGARIAAKAGVMRDVAPGETVSGAPAVPFTQWQKQVVLLERLVKDRQKALKQGKI